MLNILICSSFLTCLHYLYLSSWSCSGFLCCHVRLRQGIAGPHVILPLGAFCACVKPGCYACV